jgi:pantetheine-phosphate adenylyltransferase
MRHAVYAGSFDPITTGHMWMIYEASKMFDRLTVAVGHNPDKKYLFSGIDRVYMVRNAIFEIGLKNVDVAYIDQNQYLANFARSKGMNYMVRGIRSSTDFEFEKTLRNFNEVIDKNISSIYLIPPPDLSDVSSSVIKSLIGPEGWEDIVKPYLPTSAFVAIQNMRKYHENSKANC